MSIGGRSRAARAMVHAASCALECRAACRALAAGQSIDEPIPGLDVGIPVIGDAVRENKSSTQQRAAFSEQNVAFVAVAFIRALLRPSTRANIAWPPKLGGALPSPAAHARAHSHSQARQTHRPRPMPARSCTPR